MSDAVANKAKLAVDMLRASFPAGGQRIVLENVSAKASAPSAQTVQVHVATS